MQNSVEIQSSHGDPVKLFFGSKIRSPNKSGSCGQIRAHRFQMEEQIAKKGSIGQISQRSSWGMCYFVKQIRCDLSRNNSTAHRNLSTSIATIADYLNYLPHRLLLKAGCRWYGICTKWVDNLLFEMIL